MPVAVCVVWPLDVQVAVKLVISAPPVVADAVKDTIALPPPGITLTKVGALGGIATPTPVILIVYGLPAASLVIFRLPLCSPLAIGENVTLIPQFAFAARLAAQLCVTPKMPVATNAPTPVNCEMKSGPLPTFVNRIDWVELVPTLCSPKINELLLTETIPEPARICAATGERKGPLFASAS